jgi:hypothetical protein
LELDLNKALDLGLQAGTLEARVNDVRDRHKQLLALLGSPEVQTRDAWFHDAGALHVEASAYAPENWAQEDGVNMLRPDATTLLRDEQELAPLFTNQSIPEDLLPAWIERLNFYLRDRRAMQARLDSITGTLRAMERSESTARANLSNALDALDKLDQSLPNVLSSVPVLNAWNAVVEQWRVGGRLADVLEQRMAGRVVDKAANVNACLVRCGEVLRDLAHSVEAEAGATCQQLSTQVEALVAIAPFDAEPGMVTAQQLLNADPEKPAGGKNPPADVASLVEQVNDALERNIGCSDALDDLSTHIVTQVEPRVTRLDEAHAAAWNALQQVLALRRQIPAIKPLPVVSDEAEQLDDAFKQAEAGLENMSANGRTVKSVVGQLDSLIQQFNTIANQGTGVQADVGRDLVRLRGLWDQTSQWTRQLKRYREWQSQDAALAQAIAARLDEIDERFADIQRRYKGQPLPLEHACHELDSLLHATRREVEVTRDNGVEVVPVYTIDAV